jgi:peptide/nickel transport system substrate-binding protein
VSRLDTGGIDAVRFGGPVGPLTVACSSLMRLADEPLPRGFRAVPDLAAGFPRVSRDGTTYVFTLRKGVRFSTGAPVTAADVAFTINRILDPASRSDPAYASQYEPIVGAQTVLDGKAKTASGLVANGNTLMIRLTHPVGDFVAGPALGLCVLPAGLPFDPEGVRAPVPSAAPYYVSEYVPGQQIVLEKNRFYAGPRAHHVDRFVYDLTVDENASIDAVLDGKADYADVSNLAYAPRGAELARRFGVNKARFFVKPGLFLRMFVLNTSRPLFRNNVALRQAINYAIDRPALLRRFGGPYFGTPTDQFLPPSLPGFVNARIYPLYKPNLARARALARGHTRGGKLVLYTGTRPGHLEQAQIVKQELARIGIDVVVKAFPPPVLFKKLATPGEPFDMGWIGFVTFEPDPVSMLFLFDGSTIGTAPNQNYSYFDEPRFNRLFRKASLLTGEARYRAYGELDVELARDAAPAVAYGVDNVLTLVSARAGCVIVNPYLDVAAVCLK